MTPKKLPEAECVRVCDTCPWVLANQGKHHPAGWYKVSNLRRLWNGLRTGRAPGMVCHSSDPANKEYGGNADIKPGHEAECAGAMVLIARTLNALNAKKAQPFSPPMTKTGIARWVERYFFSGIPAIQSKFNPETEIGLPWQNPPSKEASHVGPASDQEQKNPALD
jgi:hypothetical protein